MIWIDGKTFSQHQEISNIFFLPRLTSVASTYFKKLLLSNRPSGQYYKIRASPEKFGLKIFLLPYPIISEQMQGTLPSLIVVGYLTFFMLAKKKMACAARHASNRATLKS